MALLCLREILSCQRSGYVEQFVLCVIKRTSNCSHKSFPDLFRRRIHISLPQTWLGLGDSPYNLVHGGTDTYSGSRE